jgi:hypothetical protein
MAHKLSGISEEPRTLTPHERRRQIRKGIYRPFRPMYAILKGRSITHLSRQVGTTPYQVSRILRGFHEPGFFLGVRLCLALGLTMEELDAYLTRTQNAPLL